MRANIHTFSSSLAARLAASAKLCVTLLVLGLVASCAGGVGSGAGEERENTQAMEALQGAWLDGEAGSLLFTIVGDTLRYADSQAAPLHMTVIGDTLRLDGTIVTKYIIERLTADRLFLRNMLGDELHATRADEDIDTNIHEFAELQNHEITSLNQGELIKRDTVVTVGQRRLHCYIQVNPTTYRVLHSELTDDGLAVDRIYYDNIVNINVYEGATRLFSRDYHKRDFAESLPAGMLERCILNDIIFTGARDAQTLTFRAEVGEPNATAFYIKDLDITI